MLVVSRKPGQTLVLQDDVPIEITVLGIVGGRVRLGVTAPKSKSVRRCELSDRQELAASSATIDQTA
jgi:carbon storage regulator CsrA